MFLRHEIALLCSDNSTFVLRKKDRNTLKEFNWEVIVNVAKDLAPSLLYKNQEA